MPAVTPPPGRGNNAACVSSLLAHGIKQISHFVDSCLVVVVPIVASRGRVMLLPLTAGCLCVCGQALRHPVSVSLPITLADMELSHCFTLSFLICPS